jgi:hypothetical protein
MKKNQESPWIPEAGEIVFWMPQNKAQGFPRPRRTAVVKRVHEDGTISLKASRDPIRRIKMDFIRPYDPRG